MGTPRHGRLLLVEDEARLRGLIAIFLRMEGYEVIEADDGIRGVERFFDSGPFDLVIVDLDLPRLPGVEVCRQIKAARPCQSILVCSAAILEPHFAVLDELRVDRILSKPYLPVRLLGEISFAMTKPLAPASDSNSSEPGSDDPRWRQTLAHSSCHPPHSLVKSAKSK